ncbi:DNA repair protein RecO C-terminal domain-containing protein, partial [Desulfovibrio sp. OttesenSCG-928-A18]|nr:DNA repair protein RecO C-terminal domain-containing protein [Desulfovibrio sp. OttesenSCG-928-A18]
MADFSDRALVLQVGSFKEADLWVRLLSPVRGLFTAFAFGGSRSRRRFVGCLDMFNEVQIQVNSARRGDYLALQEAVLIRGLSRLRTDWPRLGAAMNCARFLQSFGVSAEGAEKAHALTCQTVRLLEECPAASSLLPLFFRARFVFEQGYALEAERCSGCGAALISAHSLPLAGAAGQGAFLQVREGRILCPACAALSGGQGLRLDQEALRIVHRIMNQPPAAWTLEAFSAQSLRQCARALDAFIQYHVGIVWD